MHTVQLHSFQNLILVSPSHLLFFARQMPNYSRFLPIANISRIMKKALPENAKIAKEAKETVQECVSEFISFITSEACEKCKMEKRKTINGEDLLYAINTLGFDSYVDILKLYLQKYREVERIITLMRLVRGNFWFGVVRFSHMYN